MNDLIQILFTGDYYPYPALKKYCSNNPNSENMFGDLLGELREADLSGINIEFPITKSKNPIAKVGPALKGAPVTLNPLRNAGFNLAYISNNHALDFGQEGLDDTISNLTDIGIKPIGIGQSLQEARKPHIVNVKGKKIAFLNFSENEFNIAGNNHGGANPLDTIDNIKDIRKAKDTSDFVFVVIHAGQDFNHFPPPFLVKRCRFYAEEGASAVICHHSHYVSGYEEHKDVPIFYGLGNVIYPNQVEEERQKTLVVKFILAGDLLKYDVGLYYFDTSQMKLLNTELHERYGYKTQLEKLSRIVTDERLNKKNWLSEVNKIEYYRYMILIGSFPHLIFRVMKKLRLLFLLEYLFVFRKKNYFHIWNLIKRETHRDALLSIFENRYNKDEFR